MPLKPTSPLTSRELSTIVFNYWTIFQRWEATAPVVSESYPQFGQICPSVDRFVPLWTDLSKTTLGT